MLLARVVRIRHGSFARIALGLPLVCATGPFGHLPLVLKEMLEVVVAPLSGLGGPGHLNSAGDGVAGDAGLVGTCPAQTLVLDGCAFRFLVEMLPRGCAVSLSEGVASGNEGNC